MGSINIVNLIKKCVVLAKKTWSLHRINCRLERYLRCAKRNKQRYVKIESVIHRYNLTFGEDLLSEPPQEG